MVPSLDSASTLPMSTSTERDRLRRSVTDAQRASKVSKRWSFGRVAHWRLASMRLLIISSFISSLTNWWCRSMFNPHGPIHLRNGIPERRAVFLRSVSSSRKSIYSITCFCQAVIFDRTVETWEAVHHRSGLASLPLVYQVGNLPAGFHVADVRELFDLAAKAFDERELLPAIPYPGPPGDLHVARFATGTLRMRSEERRVGKERR